MQSLTDIEKHVLNDFQHGFPLVPRPYQALAEKLGTNEEVIIRDTSLPPEK